MLFVVMLSGCSMKPEEPVIPITTDWYSLRTDRDLEIDFTNDTLPRTGRGQLTITGGNGDYRIIYPKRIYVYVRGEYLGHSAEDYLRDYSEDIVKLSIEHKNIVVAQITFPDDKAHIEGYFMIEDAKKARKVFYLTNPNGAFGDLTSPEEEEAYRQRLLSDPDYWQE